MDRHQSRILCVLTELMRACDAIKYYHLQFENNRIGWIIQPSILFLPEWNKETAELSHDRNEIRLCYPATNNIDDQDMTFVRWGQCQFWRPLFSVCRAENADTVVEWNMRIGEKKMLLHHQERIIRWKWAEDNTYCRISRLRKLSLLMNKAVYPSVFHKVARWDDCYTGGPVLWKNRMIIITSRFVSWWWLETIWAITSADKKWDRRLHYWRESFQVEWISRRETLSWGATYTDFQISTRIPSPWLYEEKSLN